MTDELSELGLEPGQLVRFRRRDNERWKEAVVVRRERDGSVGLRDGNGAARSIPIGCIEVPAAGPRGGTAWEALTTRGRRPQQLRLGLDHPAPPRSRHDRSR